MECLLFLKQIKSFRLPVFYPVSNFLLSQNAFHLSAHTPTHLRALPPECLKSGTKENMHFNVFVLQIIYVFIFIYFQMLYFTYYFKLYYIFFNQTH